MSTTKLAKWYGFRFSHLLETTNGAEPICWREQMGLRSLKYSKGVVLNLKLILPAWINQKWCFQSFQLVCQSELTKKDGFRCSHYFLKLKYLKDKVLSLKIILPAWVSQKLWFQICNCRLSLNYLRRMVSKLPIGVPACIIHKGWFQIC